jgi:hypothetical protein
MVNVMPPGSFPKIRARQINEADFVGLTDLLTRGFRIRSRNYWRRAFAQLASHPTPAGLPRYGYLLECDGRPVGVILLIFSSIPERNGSTIRCNLSSWYVEPQFRSHAALLIAKAIKHQNVTYVNISPALHTRPIIEAQGFSRYGNGQFVSVPALSSRPDGDRARVLGLHELPDGPAEDRALLLDHRTYGCISLWCATADRAYPFVFVPRWLKGVIPVAQLIYCPDIDDFVRFARPIGRYLARRGRPLVIIDSNGPIAGLAGKYFDGRAPKYFKGIATPRLGNLAYTEAVMFGL